MTAKPQATPFLLAEAEMNEGPLLTGPIYSMNVEMLAGQE
jgi:hypothetical protein